MVSRVEYERVRKWIGVLSIGSKDFSNFKENPSCPLERALKM